MCVRVWLCVLCVSRYISPYEIAIEAKRRPDERLMGKINHRDFRPSIRRVFGKVTGLNAIHSIERSWYVRVVESSFVTYCLRSFDNAYNGVAYELRKSHPLSSSSSSSVTQLYIDVIGYRSTPRFRFTGVARVRIFSLSLSFYFFLSLFLSFVEEWSRITQQRNAHYNRTKLSSV